MNEAVLCGLACLAGQVGAPESLPLLRALALKAGDFTGDGSSSPRSLRLANICLQAIADAALRASLSELEEVERATRHGTVRRRAGKAIAALLTAQAQHVVACLDRMGRSARPALPQIRAELMQTRRGDQFIRTQSSQILPGRAAVAMAERLGTTPVTFPRRSRRLPQRPRRFR